MAALAADPGPAEHRDLEAILVALSRSNLVAGMTEEAGYPNGPASQPIRRKSRGNIPDPFLRIPTDRGLENVTVVFAQEGNTVGPGADGDGHVHGRVIDRPAGFVLAERCPPVADVRGPSCSTWKRTPKASKGLW